MGFALCCFPAWPNPVSSGGWMLGPPSPIAERRLLVPGDSKVPGAGRWLLQEGRGDGWWGRKGAAPHGQQPRVAPALPSLRRAVPDVGLLKQQGKEGGGGVKAGVCPGRVRAKHPLMGPLALAAHGGAPRSWLCQEGRMETSCAPRGARAPPRLAACPPCSPRAPGNVGHPTTIAALCRVLPAVPCRRGAGSVVPWGQGGTHRRPRALRRAFPFPKMKMLAAPLGNSKGWRRRILLQ